MIYTTCHISEFTFAPSYCPDKQWPLTFRVKVCEMYHHFIMKEIDGLNIAPDA